MTDLDDEPTAQELAEAEALARALERRAAGATADAAAASPAPEDALGAAALLRHAARAPGAAAATTRTAAAAAADETAHLAAVAARVRLPVAARPARRWRWRWLVPAALVPAAAAVLLIAPVTLRRGRSPDRSHLRLPAPDVALLQAQARAARGGEGLAALDREMREYRATFYQRLALGDEDDR